MHPHWKKLSDVLNVSPKPDFDCKQDIELFKKGFDSADPRQIMDLLRKLKDVSNSSTILVL